MKTINKSYIGLISIAIMLISNSCQQKLTEEIISNWPDGSVQKVYFFEQKGEIREKVIEERYYNNGTMEMHGEFSRGNRNGHWIYWFDDGRKWTESAYENDLRVGPSVVWRKSGFKNYEGSYSKGKPHGTWTFFDTDGSRYKDVFFEHGEMTSEKVYKEGVPFNTDVLDSLQFKVK